MWKGDRLLTAKDLQQILGCGKNRAYELMHTSGFPTIKIGGRMYVSPDGMNDWIERYSGRKYAI